MNKEQIKLEYNEPLVIAKEGLEIINQMGFFGNDLVSDLAYDTIYDNIYDQELESALDVMNRYFDEHVSFSGDYQVYDMLTSLSLGDYFANEDGSAPNTEYDLSDSVLASGFYNQRKFKDVLLNYSINSLHSLYNVRKDYPDFNFAWVLMLSLVNIRYNTDIHELYEGKVNLLNDQFNRIKNK